MVNCLSKFIPAMCDLTFNLRKLPKKDVLLQWTDDCEKDFSDLNSNISSDVCLQYFNPWKPVIIQVDASKRGLGAVLIQMDPEGKDKPVAYASKSLAPAETRYANMEWEILTVVFGIMRFHYYLYGWEFTCQSDSKPLENIQWTTIQGIH